MSKKDVAGKPLPSLARRALKRALLAECFKLKVSMDYDERAECYIWPQIVALEGFERDGQCGICTSGARLIAKQFGGFVTGYEIAPEDPQILVGACAGGHDFAVVGEFIVDWWGWEYEQSLESPVISRADGIALGKYKGESAWQVCPANDFRIP